MAQVSYGTITITDTTDIERIYPVYCRGGEDNAPALLPLTNWKEDISQITTTGDYIWQRIVTKKNGITPVAEDYSDAVRLTGIDGVDIVSITVTYCNHNYNDDNHKPTNGGHSGWQTNVPSYDNTYKYYWVKTTITYSEGESSVLIRYDAGLSEANANAAIANSIATHANENANGALSIASSTQVAQEALATKLKYIWINENPTSTYPAGTYAASSREDETPSIPFNTADSSTYGFNSLLRHTYLSFRYNAHQLVTIGTGINTDSGGISGIAINSPIVNNSNQITGVIKGLELTSTELKFYEPNTSGTQQVDAQLDANGLKLSKGGIEAGESGNNDFIYLSTNNYPLRSFEKTEDTDIQQDKDYYVLNNNEFIYVDEPSVTDIANYYEISVEGININGHIPTYINNTTKDIPWRQIIGKNFGVDAEGNLYATGVNISGQLRVTGGNIYTKEETDSNIRYTVDDTVDNLNNEVIYAYSSNSNGINYSYNDEFLQYRGIFVANQKTDGVIEIPPEKHYVHTNDTTIDENKIYYQLENDTYTQVVNPVVANIGSYYELIDEEPNKFNWEINPIYAEKHASNYIADFEGGIKISSSQNTTNAYLTLTAMLMQFWLSNRPMAQFGYDDIYKTYGISVENVMITGAGNALRLDNGLNGTYQGQFILETRSNGHLSLKPGLSRTEEEEI